GGDGLAAVGMKMVEVMDLRWRRRGGDVVVDRRWLVMEEGDIGSGGGWPVFGRSGAGYIGGDGVSTVGMTMVAVMDLRWRRGGDDVVLDRRWLVMEEGDDGSGGGWPERRWIFVEERECVC
nr:hypothetical protein [Tanacetum cinerariifolium]